MVQGEVCRNFELDWLACDGGKELGRIDADYIIQTAKGDIDTLSKLVPAPLEATDEVVFYMGWFKETVKDGTTTWAYPFHEWGVGIKAHLKDEPETSGLFLVQLYVDDDLVLVHGREVWGYPKKIGQMEISPKTSQDSTRYEYTVGRRGTPLISGSVDNLQPISADEFPNSGQSYPICYRQVPANTVSGIEKKELVFVDVKFDAADTMKGTAEIEINDGPFDQFPLGPLTDLQGYFGRTTFNHQGIAHRVVEATELARPLDRSRAGKAAVSA
jgi:hypothetical protein